MALSSIKPIFVYLCLLLPVLSLSTLPPLNLQRSPRTRNLSFSFPIISRRLPQPTQSFLSSLLQLRNPIPNRNSNNPNSTTLYKLSFKYTMALIITLPLGTPPQPQQMVLDTGSQLSWLQCGSNTKAKRTDDTFNPSLSSSFFFVPCISRLCRPRIPDFTLPTSCNNTFCHYSFFYADGTLAEGNLVREKMHLSNSRFTLPLVLGCSISSGPTGEGILGMNLARLSFATQTRIHKFSYCVPPHRNMTSSPPAGTFYLGENPNSGQFQYVDFLTFRQSEPTPFFDKSAYTVAMEGIRVNGRKLEISRDVFRPNSGGAGQTMIDSGTEFTYLVEEAYVKVCEEVEKLVGISRKIGYVHDGALDLCFDDFDASEMQKKVGDVVLELGAGVEIEVEKERVFTNVGKGVHCLSLGSSELLGVESNIIGNFHQQNLWVEFDLLNSRVGFGKADCSRGV